jgi:hypothetical protein
LHKEGYFCEVNWWAGGGGSKADHLPPSSSAEVNSNTWRYTWTPIHLHGMERNNFTFT